MSACGFNTSTLRKGTVQGHLLDEYVLGQSPRMVSRGNLTLLNRALQLHPNEPSLYILASSHEISQLAPTAARALFQRGLRLNRESVALWVQYVKMELGYVESLRRRWEVLGIEEQGQKDIDMEELVEESEEARRKVMDGAIAQAVLESATKGRI